MQTKRRWGWWAFIVLLIGGLTLICVRIWPHERLLLNRATRINIPRDPEYGYGRYEWVSDHAIEQTRFDWHPLGTTRATVIRYDLDSGTTTRFPVRHYSGTSHARLECSPDGRWALTWEGTGPVPGEKVTATELSTGRSLSWPSVGDAYHCTNFWLPDGKRWVQGTTLPDGYVTIYNLETPKRSTRLRFPDTEKRKRKDTRLIGRDHLGIIDYNGGTLDFREYRLLPTIALLQNAHVRSPGGREFQDAAFSPEGTHIAWICSESYISPLALLVHSWLPRFVLKPEKRLSLWISKPDGSHAYEVGHMSDQDGVRQEVDLHWLPSGKRLSFEYKDRLYTVPAK